ncbi:PstS family phosphate ABC transporter substrate-binding protein [Natrinema limicola]|uniref:Phosphate ABC transporter substrate-binding protein, phot family n=1 Tax=Natrinema limicola JCM 13563 TaxID=1230457 RepID=M0C6Y7_9EURY|nr:substrate-binding domain-containing protein [Natrinema limicola]ELZ18112.1 phosphate ABC transporter substrate-binding protein, phot family [Natrinema limicola JCM 13563]
MADNQFGRSADGVSRRKFIAATGALGSMAAAGCLGNASEGSSEGSLSADGSSTVYPITSKAGSLWNSNPPADDEEYWGPGQYDIDSDENLADYWAGLYGFEANDSGKPPFETSIGLNHTGVGLQKLEEGQVDIGDASAPVSAEFPDRSESELEPFVDHVVAVDAQPLMVSKAVQDDGLDKITLEEVQGIYQGEISDWTEVEAYDGPSKEIQVIGRAEGSGTDTSFRNNVLGDPDAEMEVDSRKGENQQVQTTLEQSDNAIAYAGLAFVSDQAPMVNLVIDGTEYTREKMADPEYPLARDLHCYTWEDTSEKEAAFIRMILHPYGQQQFVEPADYLPLTDERREEELSKLPEPSN